MEGRAFKYTYCNEDVVVLAGDIHNRNRHAEILSQIPSDVRVLAVAGNHEYYHGNFNQVNAFLKGLEQQFANYTFLSNTSVVIAGINFFGGTMFTDFNLLGEIYKPIAKHMVSKNIADFAYIAKGAGDDDQVMWTIDDHISEFDKYERELKFWISNTEGQKRVVISHFVPTALAIDPQFANSILNPYFTAEMDRYMGWDGLWLFGHTHTAYEGAVGDTRVICNPRGYSHEPNNGFDPTLIIEI